MKPNLKVGEAWPGGEDANWDSTNFNIITRSQILPNITLDRKIKVQFVSVDLLNSDMVNLSKGGKIESSL